MKMRLILSFLLVFQFVNCQITETIELKKELKEQDYLPRIEGVFTGEIDILRLGSKNGIVTNCDWVISSFKINYPCGRDYLSVPVNSKVIPENIILDLVKCALKEQVFITEIIALDAENKRHILPSMLLIPFPNDEK